MSKSKVQENAIDEQVYEIPTLYKTKYIILVLVMGVLGFVFNFPVKKIILTQVENALAKNRACPIEYSKIDISLLMPKIIFKNPKISGVCFQKPGQVLTLDKLDVKATIPVLFPPGMKFHAHIKKGKTDVNLYPRVSFGRTDLNISSTNITGDFISQIIGRPNLLGGDLSVKGVINLENHQLSKGALRIRSKNFAVNSVNVNNFQLPALNLATLDFSGDLNKKKLDIKLRAGNESTPIFAELKGPIMLNMRAPARSGLNLTGEFSISDQFMKDFSILSLVLGSKKKVNGKYILKVTGTLQRPMPNVL